MLVTASTAVSVDATLPLAFLLWTQRLAASAVCYRCCALRGLQLLLLLLRMQASSSHEKRAAFASAAPPGIDENTAQPAFAKKAHLETSNVCLQNSSEKGAVLVQSLPGRERGETREELVVSSTESSLGDELCYICTSTRIKEQCGCCVC